MMVNVVPICKVGGKEKVDNSDHVALHLSRAKH